MVLTVPGATSSSTYRVSLYAGSLTPVEAHSGRCLLAPAVSSLRARSEAKTSSYASYARRALARAALPLRDLASSVPTWSSRLSISASTRRDEEGGDGVDARQVDARGLRLLQAREVGVHDGAVAVEGEDQRDVDADAEADDLGDGREARLRRRDLDHDVRAVDQPGQLLGLGDGGRRVVGQARVDLDGDAAVAALRRVVHGAQDVGGGADVGGGHHADRLVDGDAAGGEVGELLLVTLTGADGRLEDRGVRRDAHDVAVLDQFGEVAGLDALAGQVVQPDGNAFAGKGLEGRGGGVGVAHVLHLLSGVRVRTGQARAAVRDSRAWAAMLSAVKPYSAKSVAASAEAPKCSRETMRPASPT